jgi:hypothetical protein
MSAEDEEMFAEVDSQLVADCAKEPSYISEIARKLRETNMPLGYSEEQLEGLEKLDRTWNDITENHAVRLVSFIVNLEFEEDESEDMFETKSVGYDSVDEGGRGVSQEIGSMKVAMGPDGGVEQKEWREHKLVHNKSDDVVGKPLRDTGWHELATRLDNEIDSSVSVEEKVGMINTLSRLGNTASYNIEEITQDVLERQFKYYDVVGSTEYNNPGPDFWVVDGDQREHGLVIEVTARYVNPVGDTYISDKVDKVLEMEEEDEFEDTPYDLLVLAPSFTNRSEGRYEDYQDDEWHKTPVSEMVHLHRVPNPDQSIYRHFIRDDVMESLELDGGNPIIVSDSDKVVNRLKDSGHVGDNYPVATTNNDEFMRVLDYVNREYDVIQESRYRNMVREAIEPLLWEFMRPYKIEQFLIQMYWDDQLSQKEIGRLVDRSESTIGEWMRGGLGSDRWDVVRRGTGAPGISQETIDIWKRMYRGDDPFPEPYSGYRIQAEYNRFPFWDVDDWRRWHQEMSEEERIDWMGSQDSYMDNITYTVLVGAGENRFQPSYSFILRTLKDEGVEIRPPDEAPQAPYASYSNTKTIEWMINRDTGLVAKDTEGRDLVKQEDVEVFDSYLEVDIGTWLSENDIAYAHEPFTIPSPYGPTREQWERMVKAIRSVGMSATDRNRALNIYSNLVDEAEKDGSISRLDEMVLESNFDEFVGRVLPVWNSIYDKHNLAEQDIVPEVLASLEFFDKRYVIPDIVIYKGEDSTTREKSWNGWDEWSHILEVSGLWGVDVPPDMDEDEWWQWYRVSGVAYKELAYRMLGLWTDDNGDPRVIYLVPDQPEIDNVSEGIPPAIRNDDNYHVFKSNQMNVEIDELKQKLGVLADDIDSRLSPAIEPTKYKRPTDGSDIEPVEYTFDSINMENVSNNFNVTVVESDMIVYWGGIGEVYIDNGDVYVKESMYNRRNLIMIREYVLDVLSELYDDDIVEGLVEM